MRPRLPAAFGYAIALVITGMLLVPRASHALHSGGLSCYACHALNAATVEPGTTSMSTTAMTELKTHGWVSGMRLGCTFCHRSVNAPAINDVLSAFPASAPPGGSRHPVSRNYVSGSYDNVAYMSTDNSATAEHLDCRDCHDTTLTSYPDHDNTTWLNDSGPAGRTKSTNPYGLRNVTAPKAYDNLCRDCHDPGKTTFPSGKSIGKNIALVTHDNGTASYPIRDLDNTNLKTQVYSATARQCAVCHDAHLSSNLHLFSDGHERDWNNNPDNAINELTDCTNVCHYQGDSDNNYKKHGHGKAMAWDCTVLNRNCTFCHDASQPHRPGDASYFVKYRFTTYTSSWNDNSVYLKPQRGVCATCHDNPTHSTARGQVGCIDCHDQHAKYSDNNVMMIRNRNRVPGSVLGLSGVGGAVGTEAVLFAKSPRYPAGDNVFHFYTNVIYGGAGTDNAAAGFCDQIACHGARRKGGVLFTPLSTFLTSGQHSGPNNVLPNTNCESCHLHNDPGGSFRATSSCTLCHGQPPPPADNSYTTYSENMSPHLKHAGTGYAFVCQKCHAYYTDGNYHDTLQTLGYRTYQSVFFENSVKRGVSGYDNANLRCSNITCHSDGRGGNPNDNAVWFNPALPGVRQTLDCTGCHNHDLTAPVGRRMATGAHTKHLASGYACAACHVGTVSDNSNTVIIGYSIHADNTRNVGIRSIYDNDANPNNNWNAGTTTCSGIVCHGNNPVNWVTDIGKVTCASCHVRSGDVEDFGTGTQPSMTGNGITSGIDNAEWMWSGHGATPTSHPGGQYDVSLNAVANLLSGGGTGTNKCAFCHDPNVGHDNAANPFRLANYGVFTQAWNGACYVCHAAAAVGDSSAGYAPAADNSGNYVAKTAVSKVANNHFNFGSTLNARHSTLYNGGNFCWDCHDPHGDRVSGSGNIFMIGRRVAMRTTTPDNVGIPAGGNATTYRPSVTFTSNVGGASYASTDNAAAYDGICEACHESASGVLHYVNTGRLDNTHYTSRCLDCHTHDGGFKGAGGNNIEQFFDKPYRTSGANNYNDFSRHPLRTDNVLAYPSQVDCLSCHGVANTDHRNNECLTCHWENRPPATPTHPNGSFEWAIPSTPGSQYGSAQPASDGFCLQCHGAPGSDNALNSVAPINIVPGGETWTGGSGHGQTTLHLAADNLAGPPAYNCRDCHYSTGAQTGGSARDNYPPGFHASMNRHLVVSDNLASREYPDTADTTYNADQRSTRMDNWCATQCHRNLANGIPKDDNVVDHTWDVIGLGQTRASQPGATHPSNFLVTVGARYRNPTTLPYSEYVSGAMPGTGNGVCITCHNPHGGGNIRDDNNTAVTPIGKKNMLRLSPADNVSTLCKACHQ